MKKQLLLGATALTMLSSTQAATLVDVDFNFGVSGPDTSADVAVTGLSATDGDASYTFDLLLNGTLDNGADGLRVTPNGGQCIIFNGDGAGSDSTGAVAFSLSNVVETTATGKSLVLDGITGGLFSNFTANTKSFIADRTYIGGNGNDGTFSDTQLQIDFDALTSSISSVLMAHLTSACTMLTFRFPQYQSLALLYFSALVVFHSSCVVANNSSV